MTTKAQRERLLKEGYIKRLHVDRGKLTAGDPNPITIQTSNGSIKAAAADIHGPSKLIFRPNKPLPQGAKVWVETESEVTYETGT